MAMNEKKFPTAAEASNMSQNTIDARHESVRDTANRFIEETVCTEVVSATKREQFAVNLVFKVPYYGDNFEVFSDTVISFLDKNGYKDIRFQDCSDNGCTRRLIFRWEKPNDKA